MNRTIGHVLRPGVLDAILEASEDRENERLVILRDGERIWDNVGTRHQVEGPEFEVEAGVPQPNGYGDDTILVHSHVVPEDEMRNAPQFPSLKDLANLVIGNYESMYLVHFDTVFYLPRPEEGWGYGPDSAFPTHWLLGAMLGDEELGKYRLFRRLDPKRGTPYEFLRLTSDGIKPMPREEWPTLREVTEWEGNIHIDAVTTLPAGATGRSRGARLVEGDVSENATKEPSAFLLAAMDRKGEVETVSATGGPGDAANLLIALMDDFPVNVVTQAYEYFLHDQVGKGNREAVVALLKAQGSGDMAGLLKALEKMGRGSAPALISGEMIEA